jgi:beta-galactosidase/beta-glucuronidase
MINCLEFTQRRSDLVCCIAAFVAFSPGLMCWAAGAGQADKPSWEMVKGDMVTRWARDVSTGNALPEYPRPVMRRTQWKNLNGLWEFAIRPDDERQCPEHFDDHILVPFSVASALSGVKKTAIETDRLWYRRTFDVPGEWAGQRILLHFGAVDWETTIWINGQEATHHRGGYDPFSVDMTDMLKEKGPQEIVVSAWDPSDKGYQARGKQVIVPHGFNYTGVSGIWQTVWIEPVASSHISSVYAEADIDENCAG